MDDARHRPALEIGTGLAAVAAGGVATQVDPAGPILAFAAALVVALITVVSTDRRQERAIAAEHARQALTLKGERERQDRALKAEGRRQAAALRSARELADLADLRVLLDEAAIALHRASYAYGNVRVAFLQHGVKIRETPEPIAELNQSGEQMDVLAARLAVRLGREQAAAAAFEAANDELLELSRALGHIFGDETADARRDLWTEIQAAGKDFPDCRERFEEAAMKLAGTRLPKPAGPLGSAVAALSPLITGL